MTIHREERGQVTVLRLEHGKANTLDTELFDQLARRLDEVEKSGARALVLTGTGSIFSAGVDLFQVLDGGRDYLSAFLPKLSDSLRRLLSFPLPTVAAVNGHAIAGGCVIALACDRRVLAEGKGKMGLTELGVGVPFPVTPLEVVLHRLDRAVAEELILTGRLVAPAEALELGLVEELVPPAQEADRAVERAAELAAIEARALLQTRRLLRAPTLERIDRTRPQTDPETLDAWSSPEALARIRQFLEEKVGRRCRRRR